MTKVKAIQADPNKISEYLQDPRIMALFSSLLGLGGAGMGDLGGEDDLMGEIPDFSGFAKKTEAAKPSAAESKIEEVTEEEAMQVDEVNEEEKKAKDARKESDKAKEAANALYKSKKFEEALEGYGKALELDPSNVAVLSNKSGGFDELERRSLRC
jgi:stress-induced-phosphoprotein 1